MKYLMDVLIQIQTTQICCNILHEGLGSLFDVLLPTQRIDRICTAATSTSRMTPITIINWHYNFRPLSVCNHVLKANMAHDLTALSHMEPVSSGNNRRTIPVHQDRGTQINNLISIISECLNAASNSTPIKHVYRKSTIFVYIHDFNFQSYPISPERFSWLALLVWYYTLASVFI